MSGPLPPPAARLAERQHGAIARVQLSDWMSRPAIDGLVTRGTLVRLERAVYRVAGSATTPEQQAMAAALRARPRAIVSGPLVLAVLGVDGFSRADGFIVLTQPGRRLRNVAFAHRPIRPWEVTTRREALPITTPAWTLVEVADPRWGIDDRRLRVALDHARWRRLLTAADIRTAIRSGESSPGAQRIDEVLGSDGIRAESEGERALLRCLEGVEPAPTLQAWIDDRWRVDLYWSDLALAVEYDGAIDHSSDADRARDEARDLALAARGIEVLRFRREDLRDPAAVRRRVTDRLLARAVTRLRS